MIKKHLYLVILLLCVTLSFWLFRFKRLIALAIKEVNVPIEFWGKVVDENDAPISGATIRYRVTQPKGYWEDSYLKLEEKSGSNGRFRITGHKGSVLSVESITKADYREIKNQERIFSFAGNSSLHQPDPDNPVTYTLIKSEKITPISRKTNQLILPWDGVPVFYDLETGRISSRGEIRITALRKNIERIKFRDQYDWSFKVETIDGGILEVADDRSHLAPEAGYQPSWEFGYKKNDSNWASGKPGTTHLFAKLPNGSFARLDLRISLSFRSDISGRISNFYDPSGGRIFPNE